MPHGCIGSRARIGHHTKPRGRVGADRAGAGASSVGYGCAATLPLPADIGISAKVVDKVCPDAKPV